MVGAVSLVDDPDLVHLAEEEAPDTLLDVREPEHTSFCLSFKNPPLDVSVALR